MNLREELIDLYPTLLKFAASRTGDPDLGKDLVQESLTRLLEREERLDPTTNLVAYGITIIKNLIKDRARARAKESDTEAPDVADHADLGANYEIRQALDSLGEECQRILEYLGMGHSYKDIAREEGIPTTTLHRRMANCRKKYQDAYQGLEHG